MVVGRTTMRPFAPRPALRLPRVVCQANKEGEKQQAEPEQRSSAGVIAATICAGLLLGSAVVPEDALAARSGGRVGASSFSRRSSPSYAP
jgi:uncharacterized membrane protein